MFSKLLSPHMYRIYPVTMEEIRHNTQKETRIIEALEPIMNQHRLVIDPKVIQDDYDTALRNYPADKAREYMLFYQLSRITKDRGSLKHDDRLEALAMGVRYFQDLLAVDQHNLEKNRKTDFLNEEARKWRAESGKTDNQELNCVKRWARQTKARR